MTTWKDDLARRIAALKDDDWDESLWYGPGRNADDGPILIRTKEFEETISTPGIGRILAIGGRINALPFCGAPARSLMILGGTSEMPHLGFRLRFVLRSEPWDRMYDPASGKSRPLVDSAGQSPFALSDFDAALPG